MTKHLKRSHNRKRRAATRRNRKTNRFALKTYKTISLIDRPVFRDVIVNSVINANYHYLSSTRTYSFVSTPSATPTFVENIFAKMLADSEYLKMKIDYNYMRVSGVNIRVTPISMNFSDIADLPNVYLLPSLRGTISGLNEIDVAKSDNAIPIKFSNFSSESYISRVIIPQIMQGSGGYSFGTSFWFDTASSIISNVQFQLFLGSILSPSFVPTTPAADVSRRVATVESIFTIQFGGPNITAS